MRNRGPAWLAGVVVLLGVTRSASAANYTYDALQRLTRVEYDNGSSIAYTYDPAGNRLALVSKATVAATVASAGGTVSGAGVYSLGTTVTLTAKPNPGSIFLRWEDGSQRPTRSIVITGSSVSVTAYFGVATSVLPPVISDPGAQRAVAGVRFSLPLAITSDSPPTVTVTGLPAGLAYDAATTSITGVPTTAAAAATVTIAARNANPAAATPRTFSIAVDPLPLWAQGGFGGWFDGATDSGPLTMNVSPQGKISGKLTVAGASYTFSAPAYTRRAGDGGFWVSTTATSGKRVLPLTLAVRNPVGAVPANLAVVDGWFAPAAAGDPDAVLYRNVWKDAGLAAVAADYNGYYTAVLPGSDRYGSGYLTFTVDKSGGFKVAGKLADGTPLSLSGTLILDEVGRVFAVLYSAPPAYQGGCFFGLLEFVTAKAGYRVLMPLLDDVPFLWENRDPQATPVHGAGFSRHLAVSGGWYSTVANLYDYYRNRTLTAGTDAGAATPSLPVGANRYASVWWRPDGIVLTPVLNGSGVMNGLGAPKAGTPERVGSAYDYDNTVNTVGLTVALTRASGVFKGSMKVWFDYATTHSAKNVAYEGVLTPERADRADGMAGRGFFLWADPAQYRNPQGKIVPYSCTGSYDFLLRSAP